MMVVGESIFREANQSAKAVVPGSTPTSLTMIPRVPHGITEYYCTLSAVDGVHSSELTKTAGEMKELSKKYVKSNIL